MATKVAVVSVDTLVELFAGELDVQPCYSPTLVLAICDRLKPQSVLEVRAVMYPGIDNCHIPVKAEVIISRSYKKWRHNASSI